MNVGDQAFSVRDLLKDSVATFDLKEPEIAWTAIAYELYLRGQPGWQNREGRCYTFDDLARELMSRPLEQASCGGAHLLMAMTFLLRSDSLFPVLTPPVRDSLIERLRTLVATAIKSQSSDGSWTVGWQSDTMVRPSYLTTSFYRLLVTGHLLEWAEYLPSELQPERRFYRRAANALCVMIHELSSRGIQPGQICPWTHAVNAVNNLVVATDSSPTSSANVLLLERSGSGVAAAEPRGSFDIRKE